MRSPVGRLGVVATPIGNLGDVSPRVRDWLSSSDLVASEAIPATRRLYQALGLRAPRIVSYREDSRAETEAQILSCLQDGSKVALVSEAGTPCISDPGYRLVQRCIELEIPVEAVCGPSALAAALSTCGLNSRRVCFEGFLPSDRASILSSLASEPRTIVLFEGPHKLERTLRDLVAVLGGSRRAVLLRELTKLHETRVAGTLSSLLELSGEHSRGEIVLVIEGAAPVAAVASWERHIGWLAGRGLSRRDVLDYLVSVMGAPRNAAYREIEACWPSPPGDEQTLQ